MSQDWSYDKREIPGISIPVLNYDGVYEPCVLEPKRVDSIENTMTNLEKKADHQWVIECYAYISGIPYNAKEWRVLRRWEEPNSLQRCIRWAVADRVIMSNPEDYRIFNRVTKEAISMAIFTELQNSGQFT